MSTELQTDNSTLNKIIDLFILVAGIEKPQIGKYAFRDVEHNFDYSVKEYCINNGKCLPSSDLKTHELLQLCDILESEYNRFKSKVGSYLQKHTDFQWSIEEQKESLKKQILNFTGYEPEEDYGKTKLKMFTKVNEIETVDRYLKSILKALKEAELNQVEDNKYITIEKMLTLYDEYLECFDTYGFREKRKYLLKLKNDTSEQLRILQKYIFDILGDTSDVEVTEENIKTVRWFVAYLIYGRHNIHILMIHMIIGYKYQGVVKLYQKLFLKDKSTGKKENFLHHTNFSTIDIYNLFEDSIHSTYPNTQEMKKFLKDEYVDKADFSSQYTIESQDDKLILRERFIDMPIYKEILHHLNH